MRYGQNWTVKKCSELLFPLTKFHHWLIKSHDKKVKISQINISLSHKKIVCSAQYNLMVHIIH